MAQIFHRWTNSFSKAALIGAILVIGAIVVVFDLLYKGSYSTRVKVARDQPVPFSHKHHVQDLEIDCRFCHTSVEKSAFAGLPSTQTCMTCHSQIWPDAKVLEPVRNSYRTGVPLRWQRVNDLPDFVYFNHSIHVNKGVACVTCHGPVGEMPMSWRQSDLEMKWCLQCHRNPEKFIRPRDAVFAADWKWPKTQDAAELRRWLVKEYHVKQYTDCTTCHR
jgi:hypothetical protein